MAPGCLRSNHACDPRAAPGCDETGGSRFAGPGRSAPQAAARAPRSGPGIITAAAITAAKAAQRARDRKRVRAHRVAEDQDPADHGDQVGGHGGDGDDRDRGARLHSSRQGEEGARSGDQRHQRPGADDRQEVARHRSRQRLQRDVCDPEQQPGRGTEQGAAGSAASRPSCRRRAAAGRRRSRSPRRGSSPRSRRRSWGRAAWPDVAARSASPPAQSPRPSHSRGPRRAPNQRSASQARMMRPPEIVVSTSDSGAIARATTWRAHAPVAIAKPIVHHREPNRPAALRSGRRSSTTGASRAPRCLQSSATLVARAHARAMNVPSWSIDGWIGRSQSGLEVGPR